MATSHEAHSLTWQPTGPSGAVIVMVSTANHVLVCEALKVLWPHPREEFVKRTTEAHPSIERRWLEGQLTRIAAQVASASEKSAPTTDGHPTAAELLDDMAPETLAEAKALLQDPRLTSRVVEDAQSLGIAGEADLILATYLIGTSRLLERPLAGLIQGPSGSGKSLVPEKTSALFPPETLLAVTQMTPQALFHLEPGSLKHKFVLAGERSRRENTDTAEATRALREMLSSGRLAKLLTRRAGGRLVTQRIEQEGPIAYLESTTQEMEKIFDEDRNRMVLLSTDDTPEQTRRILRATAAISQAGVDRGRVDCVIQRHHALQRMLSPSPIVIPYAERLAERFPDEPLEARRAFAQVLSMIQAATLLHQAQRQRDGDGRVIAEAADYQLARQLLERPMRRLLDGGVGDAADRRHLLPPVNRICV